MSSSANAGYIESDEAQELGVRCFTSSYETDVAWDFFGNESFQAVLRKMAELASAGEDVARHRSELNLANRKLP